MNAPGTRSSNIGVRRRRQLTSRATSTSEEDSYVSKDIAGIDNALTRRVTPDVVSAVVNGRKAYSRTAKPRLEIIKRAQFVWPNHNNVKPETATHGHSNGYEDDTCHQTNESDSDSDSLTLSINPDLEILPVARTEQAKSAFDFYINSYATSIMEVSTLNVSSYSTVVHQTLHDELLFTAFTTCSEAARWRTTSLFGDAPLNVARGYGKTVSLLSERLQSERFAMSPTILLTMGQLVAIETMIKNVSATAKHLAGMQAAMQPKGQRASPEGSAPVQTATETWTQYFLQRAMIQPTIPKTEPLTYPKHPFEPKLNMIIADLPTGFSDIALSGRLSVQMLELLQHFNKYFTKLQDLNKEGTTDSPERTQVILQQAAYCTEYHQIRTLSTIERLVLTALMAYVVRRDRIHPAMVNMRGHFQILCAYQANLLSSTNNSDRQKDRDSDLLTWVGLTLLLTSSPEAHARKLALMLLPKRPKPLKTLKSCQQFFWDDDLTNVLLSGNVVTTVASNDIIADNIKLALPGPED